MPRSHLSRWGRATSGSWRAAGLLAGFSRWSRRRQRAGISLMHIAPTISRRSGHLRRISPPEGRFSSNDDAAWMPRDGRASRRLPRRAMRDARARRTARANGNSFGLLLLLLLALQPRRATRRAATITSFSRRRRRRRLNGANDDYFSRQA